MNVVKRGLVVMSLTVFTLVGCSREDAPPPSGGGSGAGASTSPADSTAAHRATLMSRLDAADASTVRLEKAIEYIETSIKDADASVKEEAKVDEMKSALDLLKSDILILRDEVQTAKDADLEAAEVLVEEFNKGKLSEFRTRVVGVNAKLVLTKEASSSTLEQATKMVAFLDELKKNADAAEATKPIESESVRNKVAELRKQGSEMRIKIVSAVESLTKENLAATKASIGEMHDGVFKAFTESAKSVEEAIAAETPVTEPKETPADEAAAAPAAASERAKTAPKKATLKPKPGLQIP